MSAVAIDVDEIRSALSYMDPADRDEWVKAAMAIKSALGDDGWSVWANWSQLADNYREADARSVWQSIKPQGGITVRSLFGLARAYGWRPDRPAQPLPPMRQASPPPPPARDERADEERRQRGLAYYHERGGKPIRGSIVEKYLTEARRCPLPPADGDLRFIEHISEFGFSGPAMLGLVTDALDYRRELAIHITWLLPDGSGRVKDGRRPLGRTAGGCIRLWPDEGVTLGLALAEGIETALSASRLYAPIWSTLDAGHMAKFPVLAGIECLTIFADRDRAGQLAAADGADRWLDAGREALIVTPKRPGADMNEVIR